MTKTTYVPEGQIDSTVSVVQMMDESGLRFRVNHEVKVVVISVAEGEPVHCLLELLELIVVRRSTFIILIC